jgi:peptidoglycan hydrolase-like protein with peptidoglycan-binding domain
MTNKKFIAGALVLAFALFGAANADAAYMHTMTLKLGMKNTQVMALQQALNKTSCKVSVSGVGSAGFESTYFGAKTKAAVQCFQASNGLVADGVVGPMTGAKVAMVTGSGNVVVTPVCPPGFTCTPAGGSSNGSVSGGLSGTAGSATYTIVSSLSNEEVGEGANNVKVAGLQVEADDSSDIRLTAVKLAFNEGTTGSNFNDYADEVSVWLGSTKVATVDAAAFTEDNDWTKTIALSNDAIIRAGEKANLYVAVSGINNLDSADAGDTWTVDFASVRFVDAQGAVTTEDPSTSPVTFSFNTFATANNVEMRVSLADDSPDAQVVNVSTTDNTNGVTLLKFKIKAVGSDIKVKDLPVLLTVSQPTVTDDVDFIVNTLTLSADGQEFDEAVTTSAGSAATVTFDDLNLTIDEGTTMTFTVKADLNDLEAAQFIAGDTLKAELTDAIVNDINAKDQTGESISDADATGTALGDTMVFYDSGIKVDLVSVNATATGNDGADNDTGTFTIKYKVTAFDDTVYVSDTAAATTASSTAVATATSIGSNLYRVERNGTATTGDLSSLVSYSNSDSAPQSTNGNITLEDGESTTVTLLVNRTNNTTGDNGIFQAFLAAIGWNTSDSSTAYNNYYFNLADFKTDPISLN